MSTRGRLDVVSARTSSVWLRVGSTAIAWSTHRLPGFEAYVLT